MDTCKNCRHYVANEGKATGSCVKFGDPVLIKENSAVFDPNDDELLSLSEVGENFGCIHFEY